MAVASRPKFRRLRAGPYVGARDAVEATSARRELAQYMVNCYAYAASRTGAVVGRPGCTAVAGGAQLGTVSARRVQCIAQLQRLNGSLYTVLVVGGKFYTYNWTLDTVTEVALAGGAAISSAASAVYALEFADALVISDGVNQPFSWNGSTFTVLTNCPVLAGQPWEHAGRLWGIKQSEQTTLVWSEVNQANVGYEALISGVQYRNAWQLGQTSAGRLVAGRGYNDYQIIWRERSTTQVFGLVDADYATGASRETISDEIGCGAPNAVVDRAGVTVWLSADGDVYAWSPAEGLVPLADDVSEGVWNVNLDALALAVGAYDPLTGLALLGVPLFGAANASDVWPVMTRALRSQGIWTGWGETTALARVLKTSKEPRVLHGAPDGRVYRHGHPRDTLWDDVLYDTGAAVVTPIYHVVRTHALGWDESTEKFWDRVDFTLRARSWMTGLAVQARTPYGYDDPVTVNAVSTGGVWDSSLWDAATWDAEGIDIHVPVGLETHGRWQQYEIRHQTAGEQFGFVSCVAFVQDVADDPEVP